MKLSKTKIDWHRIRGLAFKKAIPAFFVGFLASGIMLIGSMFVSPSLPTAVSNDVAGIIAGTDAPLVGDITAPDASNRYEDDGISFYSLMDAYRYSGSTKIYRAVFGDSDYMPTLTDGENVNELVSFLDTKPFQDVTYAEISQGYVKLTNSAYDDHTWNCVNVTDDSIVVSDVFAARLASLMGLGSPTDILTKSFDVQYNYGSKEEIEMRTLLTYQIVGIFSTDDSAYTGINYGKNVIDLYGDNVAIGSFTTIRQLPGLSLMFETQRGRKTTDLATAYKTLGTIVQKGKYSCTFEHTVDSDLHAAIMAREQAFESSYLFKFPSYIVLPVLIIIEVICFAFFMWLSFEPLKALKAKVSSFSFLFNVFLLTMAPYLGVVLIGKLIGGVPLAGISSYPILGDNQYLMLLTAVIWLFAESIYALFGIQKPEDPSQFAAFVRPSKEINIDIFDI